MGRYIPRLRRHRSPYKLACGACIRALPFPCVFCRRETYSEIGCGRGVPFPRYYRQKLEGGTICVGTGALQRPVATPH